MRKKEVLINVFDINNTKIHIGDLVVSSTGYNKTFRFQIVRKITDTTVHFYPLSDFGISKAKKDYNVKDNSPTKYVSISYYSLIGMTLSEDGGSKINMVPVLIIDSSILKLKTDIKYYEMIMQIMNKNVTTANNT